MSTLMRNDVAKTPSEGAAASGRSSDAWKKPLIMKTKNIGD